MRKSVRSTGYASRKSRYAAASSQRRGTSIAAIRAGAFVPPIPTTAARKVDTQLLTVTLSGAVTSTWTETDLVAPLGAGGAVSSRLGNQIFVRGVRIKGVWEGGQAYPSPTAADDPYNVCRIVVSLFQKTQGATSWLGTATALPLHQPVDRQVTAGVVKVYLDKTVTLASPGVSGAGYQLAARHFDYYVPINAMISYTGNTANTNTQQLVVSLLSDSVVVPSCAVKGTVCMYYAP